VKSKYKQKKYKGKRGDIENPKGEKVRWGPTPGRRNEVQEKIESEKKNNNKGGVTDHKEI